MNQDSTVSEFDALVAALQLRLDSGDSAAFVEFLARHPHFADGLHRYLADRHRADIDDELQQLFFFGDEDREEEDLPPTRQYVPTERELTAEVVPLGRIGEYELLEKVAHGGMGIVYKARQISLNRLVAIKTIRNGRLTTANEIQRFRREAQAAAVLQHPNIVPVYEYGVVDGQHYFTMEFVDGPSLAALVREGPLDAKSAAAYVRTIARTVDYAHSRGIIHRDLKPSNVLLANGKIPRVTDFGVAKTVGHDATLSGYGQIVGTPSYMSPEQSLGSNGAASPYADIYSLGAILYALVTARPPFLAATEVDTLIQVRTQEPVAPRSLNPDIPPDLELICLKCLRKEPVQRYGTAAELADDLDRYLTGRPIVARPISRLERLVRMCRRNPALAIMASGSILGALIFVIALTNTNMRLNESIRELDKSSQVTQAALEEAERSEALAAQFLYVSEMKEAGRALRDGDIRKLVEVLERQIPQPGKHDYRGGEWYFLWERARTSYDTIIAVQESLYVVCYSPDGKSIATSGKDATIRIFNASTRAPILEIATGQVEVNGLAFSADGKTLASAGDDGTIRLWNIDWDLHVAREKKVIKAHTAQAYDVAFALDDKCLVSSGGEPTIRLWDRESGEPLDTLDGHANTVAGISISSDGKTLASASHDGGIFVWDIASRKVIRPIKSESGRLTSIALSRDGKSLVTSSMGRKVEVWSVLTGERLHSFEHLDQVERCLLSFDGSAVFACDHGGLIRKWQLNGDSDSQNLSPGFPATPDWKAHRDRIFGLAISADGRQLLSAGADGRLLAWNLAREPQHAQLQTTNQDFLEMAFVPGLDLLATIRAHEIELWNPETGKFVKQLAQTEASFRCLAVSASGEVLVTGNASGQLELWDVNRGARQAVFSTRQNFQADQVALSPDGSFIAAMARYDSDSDDLYVFDVASGQRLKGISATSCNSLAFSPDGRRLFTSGPGNSVIVWDLTTETMLADHKSAHVSSINGIRYNADGSLVGTVSDDRHVKLWNTETWEVSRVLSGHLNAVQSLAFAPGGQTLASAGADGSVKFWNIPTGHELFELKTSPFVAQQLEFSDDGRFLACLYSDPTATAPRQMLYILKWRTAGARD